MQIFRTLDQENAALVGWGVRVMLLSHDPEGPLAAKLAGLGGIVETETEIFAALAAMIDDPVGYGLFVMDCDAFGGLAAAERAMAMLGGSAPRIPVILVSADCREQKFPQDRGLPVALRAPVSAVSLRVGFEHALRDRVVWLAA